MMSTKVILKKPNMIKSIYYRLRNLILYGMFGIIAACIDYAVFYLLTISDICSIPETASLIGNISGFACTFILNTYINFRKTNKILYRFLTYALICLAGSVISTFLIHMLKTAVNPYILKVFVMAVVCCIQFILNKYVTYGK